MLNQALYDALTVVFRERPRVMNEGDRASIIYPPPQASFIQDAETLIRSDYITGGEEYAVNCPFCKDKRHRLTFHYLWDTTIVTGALKYKCTYDKVRCFNEECQRHPQNKTSIINWLRAAMKNDNRVEAAQVSASETETDENMLKNQVPMPQNLLDINSPELPYYARNYWLGSDESKGERGFTVKHLQDFGVKFAYIPYPIKLGAPPCKQIVTVLPVVQNGDYWFHQLRLIPLQGDIRNGYETDQFGEQFPKYIIPKGSRKNWALYNIDQARYYNTVYVVEGITDVMRIGPSAIARFGKTMSRSQFATMNRLLAGKHIVIIPDMDDPEAMEQAVKQKSMLEGTGNFKQVTLLKLPGGKDPGDMKGDYNTVCQDLISLITLQESSSQSLFGDLAIL